MKHTTRLQKLQKMDRERRLVVLARCLSEQKPLTMYAEEVGISYKTAKRDYQIMKNKLQTEAGEAITDYKADQLSRITAKWNEIESSKTMTDAEKHQAWARWMKLEMDLRGTAAPQKHLVGMAIPIRLGEELRAVVSQLDETQVQRLLFHANRLLTGEIDDIGDSKPIPIELIPAAGHTLGFTPSVVIPPELPRARPQKEPKQLPPVLDESGEEEESADDWIARKMEELGQ